MTSYPRLLVTCASLAVSAHAGIVYDLSTTALDGTPGENTYFVSNLTGAGLSLNSSLNFTVGTATGTNTSYIVGYFGNQTLTSVGDKLTFSVTFSGSRNPSDQVFRMGLFDSGDSLLTGNITNSNGSSALSGYDGYIATLSAKTTPSANTNLIKGRTGTNNFLFSSGSYTPVSGADLATSIGSSGEMSISLAIELLAGNTLQISTSYSSQTYIVTDAASVVNFDTFAIYAEKPSATTTSPTLAFSQLSVDFAPAAVPEPSTYAMIAGAVSLIGAIAWRRRRS